MYGRRRIWEWATVIVPSWLGRLAAGLRCAPLAYALFAVATALAASALVRGLQADTLDLNGALRLIGAGLAISVAASEDSRVARTQRAGRRHLHGGRGL